MRKGYESDIHDLGNDNFETLVSSPGSGDPHLPCVDFAQLNFPFFEGRK